MILLVAFFACKKQKSVITITTTRDYQLGESFFPARNDSAFYYFNKVATTSKDSLQIAMALNYMGTIQSYEGDYYGSQETLLQSLRYLDDKKERDHYCLMSDYNELGNTSLNLKNYKAAIHYYDQALQFTQDENVKLITLNGKAVVFTKQGAYPIAIALYQSILSKRKENKKEYARALSNFARVKWLQDRTYNAAPELLSALEIRQIEKDNFGLNASYAHLSEYYAKLHPDSALHYAGKMLTIARYNQSPDDELEALQKSIALQPSKEYVQRYLFLNDSIQTARNSAKNQFALIRYESEKAKADNLELQKDNSEKKIQLIRQQIALVTAILLVAGIVVWFFNRKKRIERESKKTIAEDRLKISQRVHDVVANGLYRVMARLQHTPVMNKEMLLDEIEDLYERSRNISYEQNNQNSLHSNETLSDLIASFANPSTKVLVKGYSAELGSTLNQAVILQLRHVLQELMINMQKHSGAHNVLVAFWRNGNQLCIQYTDDGKGLSPGFKYGNGLRNTENRMKGIGGQIIFEPVTTTGLKILLTIPIEYDSND